jgi:nucleotide-binding universal stress UspA family protein
VARAGPPGGSHRCGAIVCGAHGEGPTIGSTPAGLLDHGRHPLVVVPTGSDGLDGVLLAGYDGSESARGALRFASAHLAGRRVVVAHAWRSPVRHSLRGRAFLHSGVEMLHDYAAGIDEIFSASASDVADAGAAYARELGLDARARVVESGAGDRDALLWGSHAVSAAALLVGSHGRGPIAAAVLGSVTAGLLGTPPLPLIVIPEGC